MQWLLSTLVAGFVAFTLTDIEDLLLLIFFFSQTQKAFTKREVLLGQYLGFSVLLLSSLIKSYQSVFGKVSQSRTYVFGRRIVDPPKIVH
jgi:cadmium resistance protein CadD (predicted permease)